MANEYLKPQIPLKDLNSENYFYPLTTLDQIIIGNSRLSAYFSEDNGKLIFNNIDEDSVGGNVKLDGIIANRTLFVENDSLLSSENIFINNDSLAINTTSITSGYNFEVNGNGLFNGLISASSFFGALAEEELDKTDIRTWCDTVTNIHKSSYQGDMVLKRFYSQDEPAADYNLPCVDSHMMIFSLSNTSINWTRILALDMRSPILFIGGKSNGDWQTWTQLITDNTAQTISGVKTFTSQPKLNSGFNWPTPANITCTIGDSGNEWSIDLSPGSTTGTYWHVWSGTNGASILQCFNDNRHVIIPVHLAIGGYNNTSYGLSTNSFICNSWVRTKGSTGWYSEDHGGGWYMSDNTWLRSYNNKGVYTASGIIRSDGAVWGNKVVINGDWLGFYNGPQGATRYGYVQANNNRMYFRKENGAQNNISFDFAGHIYNSSEYISGAANGFRIKNVILRNDGSNFYFLIGTANTPGDNWNSVRPFYFNLSNGYSYHTRAYQAVWNDYAEFRQGDTIEPGRVVIEQKNGIMTMAQERLAPGAKIISDTYGQAMGETKKAKTPIAVSGRVLVYPFKDRNEYELGAAVCAAPGGTVDIMTREEIREYPERIIGTVSEIPNYDIWHCGGDTQQGPREEVKVNGRIWVYVR